jgi:hypothetical protein
MEYLISIINIHNKTITLLGVNKECLLISAPLKTTD